MRPPGGAADEFELVEVRFKGGRKEFFRNRQHLPLTTGDAVMVEITGGGAHLGHVSLRGELVRLQMRKKNITPGPDIKPIQRIAQEEDVALWHAARELEPTAIYRARTLVDELRLQMKVSDAEYQADRTRVTFYYSSEDRVDFRELARRLTEDLKTRIELRQISLRHEAGRIGGIGSCGRELCCSTWLTDFKTVSTTAARYQQLSLNPAKLAGQCGRLKCCLNYELDTYLDALKDIPAVHRPLQTAKGEAFLQKTDIFRRLMWFGIKGDNEWYRLPAARVREIQEMNRRGEQPEALLVAVEPSALPEPEVAQVEGSLDRLDDKLRLSSGKKKKKKKPGAEAGPGGGDRKPKPPKEARVGGEKLPKTEGERNRPKKNKPPKAGRPEGERAPGERAPIAAGGGSPGAPARPNPAPRAPQPDGTEGRGGPRGERRSEGRGERGEGAGRRRRGGRGRGASGESGSAASPQPTA